MKEIALTDPINIFLKEIEAYPILSREEEYRLALRNYENQDNEAAKKLILSNLKFVVKLAYEYTSYGFALSDLIQEGTIGLMHAVKKFNPHRGYRLISYAVWWIRAKIHNYIMSSWSLVKIGTTQAQRRLFQKIGSVKKKLNIPDDDLEGEGLKRVADTLGVREKDVLSMEIRTASRDFSLDSNLNDGDSKTYLDSIPDYRSNQEEIVEHLESAKRTNSGIKDGLEKLTERERYIVEKRFLSDEPLMLKDLADEFGISKERVRQIESGALIKLREAIETQFKTTKILGINS
jgi:RNA polymerase sigma-32 factor